MRALRLGTASFALATALISTGTLAQSTGSQSIEEIVVTGTRAKSQGIIVAEQAPKSVSTIDQEYIGQKNAGQSILETLNLTPGYNFVNNDAYGNSGGNVRLRGLDNQRIALLQDGIPLNDSGNYAIFSNQQLDSELIERTVVNVGTTDVDTPTAASTGGAINYITRKPADDLGGWIKGSLGEEHYHRGLAVLDTGTFGPWDTKAFVAGSFTEYEKFKGPGSLEKQQYNARIYQKLGDNGDFISILGHFNRNRNNFYRNLRLSEFMLDRNADRSSVCNRPTATAGSIQDERPAGTVNVGTAAGQNNVNNNTICQGTTIFLGSAATAGTPAADPKSGYYNLFINPSNTGNIRGQGKFSITDDLTFTVDPSYQYVLANGGGSEVVAETDPRLQGTRYDGTSAATRIARGVDLNGDGDIIDFVRLYRPNNTNTNRFGVNASLIYNLTDTQLIRAAYTYDRARHRQTGEFGVLAQNGDPQNVFGGRKGTKVVTLDGAALQNRDRLSIALLNQVAAEYRGEFMDDKIEVSLGVRAPFFRRNLDQNCYTIAGATTPGVAQSSSGSFAYCSAQTEASYLAAIANAANAGTTGIADFGTSTVTRPNALRRPFTTTVKYDKVLPNVGISFKPGDGHMIFAGYSQNLSAPRTDDLYDVQLPDIKPETTELFEVGYRYQHGPILGTVSAYRNNFKNRLVRAFDQDQGISITRQVGTVKFKGFDGQIGFEPISNVTLYGTYSYVDAKVQNDLILGRNATTGVLTVLPIKGKQLVETPKHQWGLRAEYGGEALSGGIEIKHVGDRFATDVNDEVAPKYNVVNLNLRYKLDSWGLERSFIQLNAANLFNEKYLGNISSQTNAVAIPASVAGNAIAASFPTYSVGSPATFQASINFAF